MYVWNNLVYLYAYIIVIIIVHDNFYNFMKCCLPDTCDEFDWFRKFKACF